MRPHLLCAAVVVSIWALVSPLATGALAQGASTDLAPCAWPDPFAEIATDPGLSRLREQEYGEALSEYFDEQDNLHDFYSIAAQVIPTLLVAMLFAQSLPKLRPHVRLGGLALFTFVALVGEGFALRRVLGEGDDYPDLFLTIAGIAAGAAGVLWVAVTPLLVPLADRVRSGMGASVEIGAPVLMVVFTFWAVGAVFPDYVSESAPRRPAILGDFINPGSSRFELEELSQAPQRRTLEAICQRLSRGG
jgi:hypothetical protein